MAQAELSVVEPTASTPKERQPLSFAPGPDFNNRNRMFEELVANDEDIVGLVAYALYKLSKRDWLKAFESDNGRAPSADEVKSYIIGECTPRRIETYRRLGSDALVRLKPHTATQIGDISAPSVLPQSRSPSHRSGALIRMALLIGVGVMIGIVLVRSVFPSLFYY